MNHRKLSGLVVAIGVVWLALLPAGGNLQGQAGRGSITGQITDSSGSVVPGVTVELIDTATGVRRETKTSSAGLYFFTALNPGTYELAASYFPT